MSVVEYLVNQWAIYSFIAMLPLIILYLIKPKPPKKKIPSLIFFAKHNKNKSENSIMQKLLRNTLLLIQLLIIILFCISAVGIIMPYKQSLSSAQHAIILIDASASMRSVASDGNTYLDHAKSDAVNLIAKRNTIIVSDGNTRVIGEKLNSGTAQTLIAGIKATDSPGYLLSGIEEAIRHIDSDKTQLHIISDFRERSVDDIISALLKLDSVGVSYSTHVISDNYNNIGIESAVFGSNEIAAYIRNYDSEKREVTIAINGNEEKKSISPGSIEQFRVNVPEKYSKIEILEKDSFPTDNTLHICPVTDNKRSVLVISSDISDYIKSALDSLDFIEYTISVPPVRPKTDDYDLIILNNINHALMIPGEMEDIANSAEKGTPVIITAQEGMLVDYYGMFPYSYNDTRNDLTRLTSEADSALTDNIEFGSVSKYFVFEINSPAEGTNNVDSLVTADGNPVIAVSRYGLGHILYYGLLEDGSDFKMTTGFPIFWKRAIEKLTKIEKISDLNLQTANSDSEIGTEVGVYENGKSRLCVNLLNADESASLSQKIPSKSTALEQMKENTQNIDLTMWLIIISIMVVIGEIAYLKLRGDI
ncbi:BatA domain-containing protein [Candidatus Woesearchaeota archaeon]|nr:BatA domain-containing protein [Candidatus Woesearchaeota archaeon]